MARGRPLEREASPNREDLSNRADDPDDQERLQWEPSPLELGHDGAHDLDHDDREQNVVDGGRGGDGERLFARHEVDGGVD